MVSGDAIQSTTLQMHLKQVSFGVLGQQSRGGKVGEKMVILQCVNES